MEVGHFNIVAIIQARLGSKRLPEKVLMPLPVDSKNTIISRIVGAIKNVEPINEIFLATSKDSKNDSLEGVCDQNKISCYRGSENDVLSRFYNIVKDTNFDYVLRFTADNPIIDQDFLNSFIQNHTDKNLDYSCSSGLPIGCNFEMIKSSAIIEAYNNTDNPFDKEHVTPYIKNNFSKKETYKYKTSKETANLRFTIDYASDYAFMSLMYSMLGPKEHYRLEDFLKLLSQKPWLKTINTGNIQKTKTENLEEEIDIALAITKELELNLLTNLLIDAQKKGDNL